MGVAKVEIISNQVLKPHPSPHHDTLVPLTVFDQITVPYELPLLYAFRAPMPDTDALVDGLLRTLFHYPNICGSFASDPSGHPCTLLDNTGVRVIEALVPTTLDDNLPLDSAADLTSLFPPFNGPELSYFQINRFACGGVAISVAIHHLVVDACSLGHFMDAWSKVVRGLDLSPPPYHDRLALVTPKDIPSRDLVEFEKKAVELLIHHDQSRPVDEITNVSVHFSKDFLNQMKSKANEGYGEKDQCSTFQCLLAHLWKKVTAVRGLGDDVPMRTQFAVNGRGRVKPPLPIEYFGNFVLVASPRAKVGELLGASYGEVARVIRKAISDVNDEYYKSFIELGVSAGGVETAKKIAGKIPLPGDWLSPEIYNASFLGFGFDAVDFGGGAQCSVALPKLPIEGLSIFLPSFKYKGGANVVVGLKKESVDEFLQVAHSLD